jgi:phosphomannomutase
MRKLTTHAKGTESQFIDGVKIFEGEDWVLIYPSQDEAYFHLCVESDERSKAEELADRYVALFEGWSAEL